MKHYSKAESFNEIKALVVDFEKYLTQSNKSLGESQTENNFIKPFFSALNWNVTNRSLEPERQVFQVQVTGQTGKDKTRPDYLLRIPEKQNNTMKSVLFMDAKKPSENLKTNVHHIRQVYQYAYSTLNSSENPNNRVRLAVLTDFEEFRFFDCLDPTPLDPKYRERFETFNKHVIKDWTYKDYIAKFDELWDLLEYNNVVNGSLDKWYLTEKQISDNRITPDKKFLSDLKQWRTDVARSMYRNDKSLSDYQLTKSTLLFINRIIFVKMLYDRGIEPDYLTEILATLGKSKKSEVKLYELCKSTFERLNHIYNGSIFEEQKDSDDIEISNSVLKEIFEELKPENSIYTLASMPVEIIGNVYELFIAEQIVKKGTGIALIPKYEDKKAGGVYYTPRYIVEYIVDNTLGKKLEECRTPSDVAKIKILDPACGSGSFLLVAFQKLLDWHKKWYYNELLKFVKKDNPSQFRVKNDKKVRILDDTGNDFYTIHLSQKLKSEILINNIFGVDIDPQAVMVTKFSLSIKALEDSTIEEIIEDTTLFNLPAIPKLENNIKCGNSLIGSDFYIDNRPSLFNEREKRKINTFDWEKEFPEIFKEDIIKHENQIVKKIGTHLNAAVNYLDGAIYHTEKAVEYANELNQFEVKEPEIPYQTNSKGGFDVIIGNPPYVRIHLMERSIVDYILNNYQTSTGQIDLYSIFMEKSIHLLKYDGFLGFITPRFIKFNLDSELLRKLLLSYEIVSLTEVGKSFQNVNTECLVSIIRKSFNNRIYKTKIIDYFPNSRINLVKEIEQEFFESLSNCIFNTVVNENEFSIINKLINNNEHLSTYFTIRRGMEIGKREIRGHQSGQKTLLGEDVTRYFIGYQNTFTPKNSEEVKRLRDFSIKEKLLIRRVANQLICVYDNNDFFFNKNLYALVDASQDFNLKYILSLLNSKLLNFFLKKYFTTKKEELFPEIQSYQIKQIPIRKINFLIKSEKQLHDRLVRLVEQMMENQEHCHLAKIENDKRLYLNIIASLDKQIDELVYKLYDLTIDEIKIVEGE